MENKALNDLIEKVKQIPTIDVLQTVEDRILVLVDEAEAQTAGGIILPNDAKEPVTSGVVLCVGEHTLEGNPLSVTVGDRIFFSKYAGNDYPDKKHKIKILRHSDIALIVGRASTIEEANELG